ncbi:MAG TPA: S26 family signal peptidase, partial [Planctomycetota bacterium]|nr:S26 family signal peptidase [Planctomycetota bacterium]
MTKKSTSKGPGAREAGDGGSKMPAVEAAQETARGDRTAFDSVRENLEALIIAVILAVVIRHFTVEAFEIPTGSMANTLYGLHAWLDCPNCLTEFNVSLSSDRSTGQVNVPYREMWVHDGACENPACALRLHSRGPNGGELAGPGATIGCGACGTAFQRPPGTYRRVPAIDAPARCPICHFPYVAVLLQKNKTGGHKILVNKFAYSLGSPARWDVIVFEFDQWVNYIKRLVGMPGERVQIWDGD